MELADWHQLIGGDSTPLDDARRNVVIRIQNEAGEETAAFEVIKAWPRKYDLSDFNGTGNEVAIDTLELSNEGIRRNSIEGDRWLFKPRSSSRCPRASWTRRHAAPRGRHVACHRGGRNPAA